MATSKNDLPVYLFKQGTNFESWRFFSPTYVVKQNKKQWRFRCWAPHARSVSVIGNFNGWDRNVHRMEKIDAEIWEVCIPGLRRFDTYKFSVETADGRIIDKSDPYATHTETAPANASKLYDISGYKWNDADYFEKLKGVDHSKRPLNIYEVHLGSWKRHADGNVYSYRDLADELVSYVKEMNYTHVELLPVTEFPFEGSWGYQVSGLYAPTSRFGEPSDFMYFVDKCHQAGIGVIMDFVVSHFPKDGFGLADFDGQPCYEYADPRVGEHKEWGTKVFDYSKGAVRSFLISAVCFFMENYHIDGMRMDAVASMLYLDYARKEGEWIKNKDGGNYNLEAISFLKDLNAAVLTRFPYAMMIAEESTAFPMVTMPPSVGGLGFNFKWNMGWMNDVLDYVKIDPFFRKGAHDRLTFSITYAFSENYVLPFSHDEVVHGKASMIGKMPGKYEDKFAALKALYVYQTAHPGKKLNFMGNEFGQFIEWDYKKQLDWMLLDFASHRALREFVKDLNKVYLDNPAFWERDSRQDGFEWIVVDDKEQNVVAFERISDKGERVIAVVNFSDTTRVGYEVGVSEDGDYEILLNSNHIRYDGYSSLEPVLSSVKKPNHGRRFSLKFNLESNSAIILKKL